MWPLGVSYRSNNILGVTDNLEGHVCWIAVSPCSKNKRSIGIISCLSLTSITYLSCRREMRVKLLSDSYLTLSLCSFVIHYELRLKQLLYIYKVEVTSSYLSSAEICFKAAVRKRSGC